MKFIDISWPLSDHLTEFGNENKIQFKVTRTFVEDAFHETEVKLGLHTGTHIDAPRHFLKQGKTIEQIPLEKLNGPCQVIDVTPAEEKISLSDIEQLSFAAGEIVLFKTKNSLLPPTAKFEPHFVYLDAAAAAFLADKKIKAVGIDYLGIERNQEGFPTHTLLLQRNIPLIEGLRLQHISPGRYQLLCLPLSFQKVEAAPARAVLVVD